MVDFKADVLVVGAGPTGLALANALDQLGVSLMLVEAKAHTSQHTKATNLMQGTLEQLHIYGLTDVMYASGSRMSRYMINLYGRNVSPRNMHLTESPHSDVLFLGQDLIDGNLAKKYEERGSSIYFKHRLIRLEQHQEGVVATMDCDGTTQTYWFKYVVGCDGARSKTRTFTQCDFQPIKTGKYVWQVDATLAWKRLKTMKQMWLYYYDNGFGAVIHLPNQVTKVMAFEPKESLPNRKPTLEEMQEKLRAMSGDETATLSNPTWLSHGELLTGVAPSLVDGRIILAGDACNPILPNGGQGLNIGIQDGLNLAWKLSDVLKGYAPATLLQTYNEERRALRLALEKVQINTLKYTLPAPKLNRWFLGKFGHLVLDKFWSQLARMFSQLTLNYKNSPLSKELLGKKGVQAGRRILDADVVKAETNQEVALFEELAKPQWKLLVFDAGTPMAVDQRIFEPPYHFIQKYLLTSALHAPYPVENLYFDLDEVAHRRYQIKQPQYLLVRPDNYIALRCGAGDWSALFQYLEQWFVL